MTVSAAGGCLDLITKMLHSDLLDTVFGGREFHSFIVVGTKLAFE